ncbi:uncharacterized protein LOC108112402 [Drosophila eugracilis]|uniref:uncharacterized protein LOC108112402 n=1 Tax=Drosophila eugracilis TaxID=29029 RepID=UPI001BD918A4|nr:uncharacterized protein LOC108112402 [Drosophila eugracilis]
MARGQKRTKKDKLQPNGRSPKKRNLKNPLRHHVQAHGPCQCLPHHPRPRIHSSKMFHDNCCKYKVRPKPRRINQCDLATQCPSRIVMAPTVPTTRQTPIGRNAIHLPETVVMQMRNTEDARRAAESFRNTLIQAHVPGPDLEGEESLERLRQIERRPRHVFRKGREKRFPSDTEFC